MAGADFSLEQLNRLKAKLADVKEELNKQGENENSDVGEDSYVRISEDNMTAYLYLGYQTDGSKLYAFREIMQFIEDQGVKYGVDGTKVNGMLVARMFGQEMEVAHGTPMEEGQDGYYEYGFNTESHAAPKELPDGRVDYTNMKAIENIREGDMVATYHHQVPGKEGRDVRGNVIKPKLTKDLPSLRGLNIKVDDENPDIYRAMIDGKIELRNGNIDIQATHEIRGDVDWLSGKVEFYGDIIINGNVEAGVTLRAGRNIIVNGTVGAVQMFAGGDITISRGVQGNQKAKLSARGNVLSDFLEHCVVEAGGDVKTNAIIDSTISAGGKVILTGKKGRVIGGYTHAMAGLKASCIGNVTSVKTVVHVGYEPRVYEEFLRLSNEEKTLADRLQKVLEEMAEIIAKRTTQAWDAQNLERKLPALDEEKDKLFARLDSIRSDIEFYQKQMEKGKGSMIEVRGPVYSGTIVGVEAAQMEVAKDKKDMRFTRSGGRVQATVIPY